LASKIRLQPENHSLEPLSPEHVQILGKVTGVFRSLSWTRRVQALRAARPHARPEAGRPRAGSKPRVPRLRRVRLHVRGTQACPECRLILAEGSVLICVAIRGMAW